MQMEQEMAQSILAKYGIPSCRSELVTIDRVHATRLRYPLVLKTAAREVLHKSDIGAVVTGIKSKDDLVAAAKRISSTVRSFYPEADDLFIVQEQMDGREMIIGMKRDPAFGPVIMFGLGGIFVEVFKDVSFRIAPLEKQDAIDMMSEIKGSAILKGARGGKPVNIEAVADIIMKVAKLSIDNEDISELDLNPVMADEHGAKAVDVRIMGDFH